MLRFINETLACFPYSYEVKYWRILEQSIHLKLFGEVTMIVMILTITKINKKDTHWIFSSSLSTSSLSSMALGTMVYYEL